MSVNYAIDIVMCIDKTGSMAPVIDTVKENALRFEADLKAKLESQQKLCDQLRVRVIAFGDIYADGDLWARESSFFDLPADAEKFRDFISDIHAEGGGDEPENGLEALAMAIKSPWTTDGIKRRHVVVVWTDASAHPLEKRAEEKVEHYPDGLPRTFDELKDLWDSQVIGATARRLVLFAPDAYPWAEIATHWDETIQFPSRAGEGLSEHDYNTILENLASSI